MNKRNYYPTIRQEKKREKHELQKFESIDGTFIRPKKGETITFLLSPIREVFATSLYGKVIPLTTGEEKMTLCVSENPKEYICLLKNGKYRTLYTAQKINDLIELHIWRGYKVFYGDELIYHEMYSHFFN